MLSFLDSVREGGGIWQSAEGPAQLSFVAAVAPTSANEAANVLSEVGGPPLLSFLRQGEQIQGKTARGKLICLWDLGTNLSGISW